MKISNVLTSYPAYRAFVAGLSFIAALVGGRLLSSEQFATLMTAAFVAKFLQIMNFGATAGYFVSRYSGAKSSTDVNAESEPRFLFFFLAHMTLLGLLVLGIATVWLPKYSTGGLAFLLLVPIFVVEPSLRYRRFFSFSLMPELVLSLAMLSVTIAVAADLLPGRKASPYIWVVAFLSIGVMVFISCRHSLNISMLKISGFGLRRYCHVLAMGSPVYFGSALFIVASSADRLLLPLYGSDSQIGIYLLAYQLCVGAMIFLTAINFVNTVNLGEARKSVEGASRGVITQKLRVAVLVALGSYLALCIGSTVLEVFFLPPSFTGLSNIVSLLGVGLSAFYISNAVTPIAAYFRRQMPLTIAMALVALALLSNNAFVYWQGLDPVWLASGTALAFVFYGVFAIWFTFKVLGEKTLSGS